MAVVQNVSVAGFMENKDLRESLIGKTSPPK
jgi:hypothetical protein